MESLKELKSFLAEELENSFRRGMINNMPRVPMAVIYADSGAAEAKTEIDSVLLHLWGERKNAIVQIALDDGRFLDPETGNEMSEEEVQVNVDDMYSSDNSFRDMTSLCTVILFNTSGYADLSSFQDKYEIIREIEDIFPEGMMTVDIVLLDESTRGRRVTAEIRNYLADMIASGSNPYKSTFLLSNRLSNGSLLGGTRMKENYALAGWTIALLNGTGAGYMPDWGMFFPATRDYYLTASFSEINRPNEEICDIVLHTILSWIDEHLREDGGSRNRNIDVQDLYQRLEISGGQARFIDDFYQKSVCQNMPSLQDLKYLTRSSTKNMEIGEMDFQTFNTETFGACGAFLEESLELDSKLKEEFVKYLREYVRSRLSASERERVLTAANVQDILRKISVEDVSPKERMVSYFSKRLKEYYLKWALPICEEFFKSEQKASSSHAKEFEEVLQEFQQGYFPNEDVELERYYSTLTLEELERASGGLGTRLLNDVMSRGDQKDAILDCLKNAVEEIFSSQEVFHMPLEQEMVCRMGQNPTDIHNQICRTLFGGLDQKIRLKTAFSPSKLKQIIIVNQRKENRTETELFQSIKMNTNDSSNVIFFDSCNRNTIKIIHFYRCENNNIMV